MRPTFLRRMIGAAMLDPGTYEEVERDPSATPQALAIVVFSALAAGIGAKGAQDGSTVLAFFAQASVIALLAWAGWALLTYEVGSHLLPAPDTHGDAGELLRTLGFAATPGLLQVFAILPRMRGFVFAVAILWTLAGSVVAVRQALDYRTTTRALAVCVIAALMALSGVIIIGVLFGPAAAAR